MRNTKVEILIVTPSNELGQWSILSSGVRGLRKEPKAALIQTDK